MQLYKKQPIATQYFIIATFLLALAACSPKQQQQIIDCKIDPDQCLQLSTENSEIQINTRTIIVEQNYKMTFSSNSEIAGAKLEGINMNMGTIPVLMNLVSTSEKKYVYQADMFLGMCSEPYMQWLLTIKYKNGTSETTTIASYWQLPQ